jgi:hypothetical protein
VLVADPVVGDLELRVLLERRDELARGVLDPGGGFGLVLD